MRVRSATPLPWTNGVAYSLGRSVLGYGNVISVIVSVSVSAGAGFSKSFITYPTPAPPPNSDNANKTLGNQPASAFGLGATAADWLPDEASLGCA